MFGCAWKIKFPKNIFNWPCVLVGLTRKWFEVKIFTSNHFWTHAQRHREREREPRSLLRPSSSPMTTDRSRRTMSHQRRSSKDQLQRQSHRADRLQSPTTHTSVDRTAPIKQRSTPTPLNLASTARSDEFFFLGFVSFVFLYDLIWWFFFFWVLFLLCFCIEEWYYIFV